MLNMVRLLGTSCSTLAAPAWKQDSWRSLPSKRVFVSSTLTDLGWLSHFQAGRRLLDWPDDVVELANSLRIDHFAVVGVTAWYKLGQIHLTIYA
jgi:hypothetical protein